MVGKNEYSANLEGALAGEYELLNEIEAELERIRSAYKRFKPTPQQLFCVFFILRAIRGTRAVRLLTHSGLAAEAATVLRGMLEDVVTVHYVLADFALRFDKWVTHSRVREAYYADIALRIRGDDFPHKSALADRIDCLGGVPKGPSRDRWDVGFASMARAVSEVKGHDWFFKWFEVLYAPLCDVAHGHSGPSIEYLSSSKRDLRDQDVAISFVLVRTAMVLVGLLNGLEAAGLEVCENRWDELAMTLHDAASGEPG